MARTVRTRLYVARVSVSARQRPRVVLTTTASVDGRVTLTQSERLLEPGVFDRWRSAWPADVEELVEQRSRWLEQRYAPRVTMEGSGTFVVPDAVSPWAQSPREGDGHLYADHLPRRAPRWYAVVDGRGRVDWQFTDDDETALLVLACRATPSGYLRRLRELEVGYLVAADDAVDLPAALRRVGDVLDAGTVIADGGGGINAALLRADLVDEVHVITFPALIGGLTTPSFVDGPPLPPGSKPLSLRPRGIVQGAHGSTWARYDIERLPAS